MKCPGQDMKYWKADAIFDADCPKCGKAVEFYKDDTTRRCHHCGHRFVNPSLDFGCAAYCKFAEQCIGTLPEEAREITHNLLKDKVAVEIKKHYHNDFKAIRKVTDAARFAENIGRDEGGNLAAILCTTYLFHLEPDTATTILAKVGATQEMISQITDLLEQVTEKNSSGVQEEMIIEDAIELLKLQEMSKQENLDCESFKSVIDSSLHTSSAKKMAHDFVSC